MILSKLTNVLKKKVDEHAHDCCKSQQDSNKNMKSMLSGERSKKLMSPMRSVMFSPNLTQVGSEVQIGQIAPSLMKTEVNQILDKLRSLKESQELSGKKHRDALLQI